IDLQKGVAARAAKQHQTGVGKGPRVQLQKHTLPDQVSVQSSAKPRGYEDDSSKSGHHIWTFVALECNEIQFTSPLISSLHGRDSS
ncbi:hypothetical protein M513_14323, partial [Trichuris suis]